PDPWRVRQLTRTAIAARRRARRRSRAMAPRRPPAQAPPFNLPRGTPLSRRAVGRRPLPEPIHAHPRLAQRRTPAREAAGTRGGGTVRRRVAGAVPGLRRAR